MQLMKPVIFIGLPSSGEQYRPLAEEVGWGIEEEGCMYDMYFMDAADDIRYSSTETAVIINEVAGNLYVRALDGDYCMQRIKGSDANEYRLLGKNAARYLKKKHLIKTGGNE